MKPNGLDHFGSEMPSEPSSAALLVEIIDPSSRGIVAEIVDHVTDVVQQSGCDNRRPLARLLRQRRGLQGVLKLIDR